MESKLQLKDKRWSTIIDRIGTVLSPESKDVWMIVFYGVLVSFLSLAVPVAVQSLVNSLAYGQLTQQLLVLSIIVFLVLSFSGFFSALQYYCVEILQRRLFTRYAMDLAIRIPRFETRGVRDQIGAEFVNPFLEVITLHKSLAHLFLGGLSLLLQITVGVVLLGTYHPLLLLFSLCIVGMIYLIFSVMGRGGIATADKECSAKYQVLAWLEDMARMPIMFHSSYGEGFGLRQADDAVKNWLDARSKHFKILFRQNISMFAVHAIASSLLLALGGMLVIQGQLTLGQIVAAELVLNTALSGLSKFGKHVESYYDLMAASLKLDNLRNVPLEAEAEDSFSDDHSNAASLELRDFTMQFENTSEPLFKNINLTISPGDCVALYGLGSSGKTFILDCIYGLVSSYQGQIRLDGYDLKDVSRKSLRTRIGLVGEPEFFHGTLEDNLTVGAPHVTSKQLREALDTVCLDTTISRLPNGLKSIMTPKSGVFSRGELIRFSIVRAVLSQPGLILIDQNLDQLDRQGLSRALSLLLNENRNWSMLITTNQTRIANIFESSYHLHEGELRSFDQAFIEKNIESIKRGFSHAPN